GGARGAYEPPQRARETAQGARRGRGDPVAQLVERGSVVGDVVVPVVHRRVAWSPADLLAGDVEGEGDQDAVLPVGVEDHLETVRARGSVGRQVGAQAGDGTVEGGRGGRVRAHQVAERHGHEVAGDVGDRVDDLMLPGRATLFVQAQSLQDQTERAHRGVRHQQSADLTDCRGGAVPGDVLAD